MPESARNREPDEAFADVSAIPTETRKAVRERDRERCRRCGAPGREIHHRMRRREGGHRLSNLVLLCSTDHRFYTENPGAARRDGAIVPTWGDPETTPMRTYAGWVRFSDDGGVILMAQVTT